MKYNEIFTKGHSNFLKNVADKRQVKHTSTVLEPSMPFHTPVKLVDAEDIANDKIRTHNLALEVNSFTKHFQLKLLTLHNKNNSCLHNLEIQITKVNLHITIMFLLPQNKQFHLRLFKKQRYDEDKGDAYARSKSPQKSFLQYFRSPSNDRSKRYDTCYRSRSNSRNNYYNKILIHKTDFALHPEIDLVMTKVLLLHNTLDH